MNCTEARSAMLACDLAELQSRGDMPLARHIERCQDCRALADAVAAQTATLRTALALRAGADTRRPFRRGRAIGALMLAAGLLLAVTLVRRTPQTPASATRRVAQRLGTITIENAQGRPVTVVEGRNTIDVVFHYSEPNE